MNAVMKSVTPKICEKIAKGKCTVLLSKIKPKFDAPFKCYIYCANGRMLYDLKDERLNIDSRYAIGENKSNKVEYSFPPFVNRKVIGEFVCDKTICVQAYEDYGTKHITNVFDADIKATCLTEQELWNYITNSGKKKDISTAWLWHISNLVIYYKPKELREFRKSCDWDYDCNTCKRALYEHKKNCFYSEKKFAGCDNEITRPPINIVYVDEIAI